MQSRPADLSAPGQGDSLPNPNPGMTVGRIGPKEIFIDMSSCEYYPNNSPQLIRNKEERYPQLWIFSTNKCEFKRFFSGGVIVGPIEIQFSVIVW